MSDRELLDEEKPLATVWISHDGRCLAEEIKGDDPYAAIAKAGEQA